MKNLSSESSRVGVERNLGVGVLGLFNFRNGVEELDEWMI